MQERHRRDRFRNSALRTAVVIALACLTPDVAGAMQTDFAPDSSKALAERVRSAGADEYGRVLKEFDAHLGQHPTDAVAAVERCRFIETFAYSEDEAIPSANGDLKTCQSGLVSGTNARAPEVKTYLWSTTGRNDTNWITQGELLLTEPGWPARVRLAIHEGLSSRLEGEDDTRAGQHAIDAVELNSTSDTIRIRAAEHYIRLGAKSRAVQIIEEIPASRWNQWTLETALGVLINMGEGKAARKLVESRKDVELSPTSRLKLAGSLVAAGEEAAGRALAEKITHATELPDHYGTSLEREIFAFQLRYGTPEEATAAYRQLRDKGFNADIFARRRLALTATYWKAPWRWPDLAGVFALLALIVGVVLLPAIVILPVHYRSVVKQLRGFTVRAATPESPWSLSAAWYALTVMSMVGILGFYVFCYTDFESAYGSWLRQSTLLGEKSSDLDLGRAVFGSSIVSLLLVLPLLGRNARSVLLGQWSVKRSILTGVGTAYVLLKVLTFISVFYRESSTVGLTLGTNTVRSLQGMHSLYGAVGLFTCVALVVPIAEEIVFRGVLMRSVSRHVSFWIAALLQAVVFVLAHEDKSAFPVLFVFAITCSWLAARSGGLLAPIAMHSANNAFAAFALLRLMSYQN